MVVYIEPLAGQVAPQTQAEISIGQRDKSFTPYISVIQRHQKVSFVNHDDITHHIYSVDSDNKFDFKIKAGMANTEQDFEKSAEIAMGCNIHDWMSGYLLVLDTPYFAKTDSSGIAKVSLAQKGLYKVVIWHPQLSAENNRMEQEAVFEDNAKLS
jgi:plastocyanin